jgi:hypothetical protein
MTGRYAYVADGSTLRVINVVSSTNPYQVAATTMPSSATIQGMQVVGRYIYLATSAGLMIYDLNGISSHAASIDSLDTGRLLVAANTYALGTATTNQYSTIYGQSIFVNGSAVCDAAGNNCPTGLYVNLQAATPGSQQTGNLNISGAALVGYLADTSNSNYGIDPAGTSNFGGFSLKVTGASLLALDSGNVGIGTGTPVGKLHVDATAVGKALAIFLCNGRRPEIVCHAKRTIAQAGDDTTRCIL